MMLFTADMKPKALIQNKGKPKSFTCDFCGSSEDGVEVNPGGERENWAVLPEGWAEVEDRREKARKQFPLCCTSGDCRFEAEKHTG